MLAYFIENKLIPLPAQRNSVWRKSLGRLKMSLGHRIQMLVEPLEQLLD